MHTILGIRHHGPGSTRALERALAQLSPDCILMECPNDVESLVEYVDLPGLRPPVAMLVYDPKAPKQAAYLPYAEFSPEWQTMRYARREEIPLRCMDLPMSMTFGLAKMDDDPQLLLHGEEEPDPEAVKLRRDPLGAMAALAGYSDGERWWEVTFEQADNDLGVFAAILEMMDALRGEIGEVDTTETLRREAFMRKILRQAIKDGYQNIAVVCGAYHGPALVDLRRYPTKTDNALLRGIKKVRTAATWVPWTYDRLSYRSGYGAGVLAPVWYEMLYRNRSQVILRWMTRAARLFRAEGLDISPAHAIQGVRLAHELATLRGRAIAGITELREATVSVFCGGNEAGFRLIEEKLITGDVMGKVPDSIPVFPLQRDLEKQVKSARLSKEYATTETIHKDLDLRKPGNLLASRLLHRLLILGLPWGTKKAANERARGSFQERWKLKWKPDFAVQIIEAGMWGSTVEEAAANYLRKTATDTPELAAITAWTERALKADLPAAVTYLLARLERLAAVTDDIYLLLDTLPPLVRVLRFGDTRQTDVRAAGRVVEQLVPRLCIGLPAACSGVDEERAGQIFEQLRAAHRAVARLQREDFTEQWERALASVATTAVSAPLLRGGCVRLLFDRQVFDLDETVTALHYALSPAAKTSDGAAWLEGFLHGSGLILVHVPALWNAVNGWIDALAWDDFTPLLPLLRRTFASFSGPEREQLLTLARRGPQETVSALRTTAYDERALGVLPTLATLFGNENA